MANRSKKVKSIAYRGGWFRLYSDTIESGKVHSLSDQHFRFWINSLCIANKFDGLLPSTADIAYRLRMDVAVVAVMLRDLINAKLIDQVAIGDDLRLMPHDWSDWQPARDLSTGRVRKFRERKRVDETDETAMKRSETLSCLSTTSVERETRSIQEENRSEGKRSVVGKERAEGTYGNPANVVTLNRRPA